MKDKQKWLKVHCCVNAKTGEVLSNTLTDACTSDSSQVKPLLDELPDQIEKFYGDGAYDPVIKLMMLLLSTNHRLLTPLFHLWHHPKPLKILRLS